MPPITRNLNEIDERFDNKDTKVNILVDLNETFLYEYCVYSPIRHPPIPSAQQQHFLRKYFEEAGWYTNQRSTSKSRIIMIGSCKLLFSQKKLNILAFNFEGFSFLYFITIEFLI